MVLVRVVNMKEMVPAERLLHIDMRHHWLRYASRGEHDADHRLHPDWQDHKHDEQR
jgi:hypothetical protein